MSGGTKKFDASYEVATAISLTDRMFSLDLGNGKNVAIPYQLVYNLFKSMLDEVYRTKEDSYTKGEVDGLLALGIKDIQPSTADDTLAGIKFPTENGTYTNYGGIVVDLAEGLTMIFSDGIGGFTKVLIPIDLTNYALKSDLLDENNLAVLEVGKNVFNKDIPTESGQILLDTGANQGNPNNLRQLGFQEVKPSTTYKTNATVSVGFVEYDEDYVFIKGQNIFGTTTVTTATNTKYFKAFWWHTYDISTIQIEEGTVSTAYESFTKVVPESVLKKAILKSEIDLSDISKKSELPDFDLFPKLTVKIGKNVFNKDIATESGQFVLTSGNTQGNANSIRQTDFQSVKPSTTYKTNATLSFQFIEFDENYAFVKGQLIFGATTVTTAANTRYFKGAIWHTYDLSTIQIEEGTVSTAYEPFTLLEVFDEYLESQRVLAALSGKSAADFKAGSLVERNELSVPSKLYLMSDENNHVYFKSMQKKWDPFRYWTRLSGNGVANRNTFAVINRSALTEASFSAELYNEEFEAIASKSITAKMGSITTDNGAFKILSIGDSWTTVGHYLDAMINKIPNVTSHGIIKALDNNIMNEGRGGWRLDMYFSETGSTPNTGFSPFLQPAGSLVYYGYTAMWIAAQVSSSHILYDTAVRVGFNATTGYKTSPTTNTVMYSDTNGRYEKWNGSAWEAIDLGTINFSFNFEKYRQVWGISQPDLVTILLGVNDFNGATFGTDLTNKLESFVTNMDLAIASVKADSSAIKLAVLLPTNAYGAKESGNLFVPYMNAINFVVRKRLIDEYDNREAEGIYLIDTSVAVDDDFGFREFEALPFPEYEPSPGFDTNGRKRWYSADSYHPSEPGYAQLGSKLAAFIQNIR